MSNLFSEREEMNTRKGQRPTSVGDRRDRIRSSPSRQHIIHSRNENQGCHMIHLNTFQTQVKAQVADIGLLIPAPVRMRMFRDFWMRSVASSMLL